MMGEWVTQTVALAWVAEQIATRTTDPLQNEFIASLITEYKIKYTNGMCVKPTDAKACKYE